MNEAFNKMKCIMDVYPDLFDKEGEFWYTPWDYNPLLKSMGFDVLLHYDDEEEQKTNVIFRDGMRLGLLTFAMGDSPDTDPLQACESYEDIEALRDNLLEMIKWDNPKNFLSSLMKLNWEFMQYSAKRTRSFIQNAIEKVRESVDKEDQ
ncbi:MAG: hypothetical protein CVV50_02265 [Spirochaetae bacterium HGW-Spirochaetae-6]|jgi:hypothetical protein|nr:MAG: hypothetical protein CVV50_02265 [Spirochaetae bacterium HGW-Spirochaetae-6]